MIKIIDRNWFVNYTSPNRYSLAGITDLVLDHSERLKKFKLTVIDVGCSTAVSLKELKKELNSKGIGTFTIGIDVDPKVKEMAEKNSDIFLNKDVLEVDNLYDVADVVICHKMALWVPANRRSCIISKSSQFLKLEGDLITDVDDYRQPSFLESLSNFYKYSWPPIHTLRYGIKNFRSEYKKKRDLKLRKDARIFYGRETSLKYAKQIISGWNKLAWDQKVSKKFDILCIMIQQKLFPSRPKN